MIKWMNISYFKSIVKSKVTRLEDLSVFIGNNGSGKSSVIEALKTLQDILLYGLSEALNQWGGYERVRNYEAKSTGKKEEQPIKIDIIGHTGKEKYHYTVSLAATPNGDFFYVAQEKLTLGKVVWLDTKIVDPQNLRAEATFIGATTRHPVNQNSSVTFTEKAYYHAGSLFIAQDSPFMANEMRKFADYIRSWQFLNLNAHILGFPVVQNRTEIHPRLLPDGSNIAVILRRLADYPAQLDALVDKMRFVLPYLADLRPQFVDEIERKVFLEMKESGQAAAIPGWLLSTGTLRVLVLLVALSQEPRPSVLFIEEIENGLDPRTIGLILSEVQSFIQTGQVIATTHSPYFLDLLDLRHLIVTEKDEKQHTCFHRVDSNESLQRWKEKFSPGQLYTMGKLNQ